MIPELGAKSPTTSPAILNMVAEQTAKGVAICAAESKAGRILLQRTIGKNELRRAARGERWEGPLDI